MIFDPYQVETLLNFFQEGALAFILIFTIVYFLLDKVKIFKDSTDPTKANKKVNLVIALALAIAAITPHFTNTYYGYGQTIDVVQIINSALPNVSLIIIAVVLLMVLISVFGIDINIPGATMLSGLAVLFSLFAIIYIFLTSAGIIVEWDLLYWLDEELKSMILLLLVMGVIIWFITKKEGGANDDNFFEKFLKKLTKQ